MYISDTGSFEESEPFPRSSLKNQNQSLKRILGLFSRAGLSMDHHQFDEEILDKGTKQILKTRDGKLRAAVPSPLGSCVFLNDVSHDDMVAALRRHKEVVKNYPRNGEGLDAFFVVDQTEWRGVGSDDEAGEDVAQDHGLLEAVEEDGHHAGHQHDDGHVLDKS